jgi:hypothetical protein
MDNTQPQLISTAAYAPVNGKNATPFSQQTVVLTKRKYSVNPFQQDRQALSHHHCGARDQVMRSRKA